MKVGMIGLGRMGGGMAQRLALGGIGIAAWDHAADARAALSGITRITTATTLAEMVALLDVPRVVWLMLPAGAATDETVSALAPMLALGDTLVDGANAHYRDSQRRSQTLAARGLHFVDAGVSGGVWGMTHGYGLMLGGTPEAIRCIAPLARILAPTPSTGWLHCGSSGAGHFTKMVHNGIEYGLMQAYAEGLALLAAKKDLELDVAAIAGNWRHGSVIRSWLLDLTAEFLAEDSRLDEIAPVVADSGEGRWTTMESVELGVPTPVMTLALMERFASQGSGDYGRRLLARMRQAFGGHSITVAGDSDLRPPRD